MAAISKVIGVLGGILSRGGSQLVEKGE